MWDLSRHLLANMPEESAILDQLRADRKLPEQANYREWRSNHLTAYQAAETREDWWHLPDGRTLRFVATPNAEGGLTYIYENVTEQLSLESQVNSLSQLQGETLDHLSEGVVVFASDGKLQLFNPVFAEIWRLSPSLLSDGPHVSEVIEQCSSLHNDAETWENIRIAATDIEHSETLSGSMERPDQSVIDYATVALPEGMTMITFVDVSDSARMQRALSERNEALEAADRLKTDFIQHVSYELRSPLTSIIGFAEMMADETIGPLNRQQGEYMGHISSSSSSLLAIINDILDLATVDAGIMELEITEVDVHGVALSAVEGLRDRLEEQQISFSANIPSDAGTFRADENRVRQILFNLVANAIRFSNANGQIELMASKENGWVVFTVKDDGVGIPGDILPAVFEPFEGRGGGGRRRGAGLGLSIVKSLVELHGGSVDLESTEGVGTQVTLRLPEIPHAAAVAAE
jgi:signal transduction histidine kinase